jgi:hypothetical protein
MRRPIVLLVVLCTILTAGTFACRTAPTENVQSEAVPKTLDGLQLVVSEKHRNIYVKPGVDLGEFSQVLIDPFMVSYTSSSENDEGPVRILDTSTEEKLSTLFQEGLKEKIGRSGELELADGPGPGVLRVQGWLYDVVVGEQPFDDARNSSLCFARMAVIVTARDSRTAQALAHVMSRTRLSCSDTGSLYQTAQWSDVKKGLQPWLSLVAGSLEELRHLSLAADGTAP